MKIEIPSEALDALIAAAMKEGIEDLRAVQAMGLTDSEDEVYTDAMKKVYEYFTGKELIED